MTDRPKPTVESAINSLRYKVDASIVDEIEKIVSDAIATAHSTIEPRDAGWMVRALLDVLLQNVSHRLSALRAENEGLRRILARIDAGSK